MNITCVCASAARACSVSCSCLLHACGSRKCDRAALPLRTWQPSQLTASAITDNAASLPARSFLRGRKFPGTVRLSHRGKDGHLTASEQDAAHVLSPNTSDAKDDKNKASSAISPEASQEASFSSTEGGPVLWQVRFSKDLSSQLLNLKACCWPSASCCLFGCGAHAALWS